MRTLAAVVAAAALAIASAPPAVACLWDYDTLKEETLSDRDTAAVLRGEHGHHGAGFYPAKLAYTRPLVDAGTAPKERYDDLAVALARTGAHDDALAVLAAKDQRFPGEYTTHANRGTFLAMKGDVAGALVELRRALTINPDAHFGREEFQVKLLEYKLRVAKDPTLRERETFLGHDLKRLIVQTKHKDDRDLDRAVTAMVGLVRFGGADRDPDLWFGLAWTLMQRGDNQLALMALRRAELAGHPRAKADGIDRSKAIRALERYHDDDERWRRASSTIDRALAKGAAVEARRHAAEAKLLARKRWRAAFGY
jgi:tetratricopeptide (TPR) repeat protein